MLSVPLRLASEPSLSLSICVPKPMTGSLDWAPGTMPQATKGAKLQQPEPGQLAAQRFRHVGEAGLGLVDVRRRRLGVEIAPALKRPHRPGRDRDHSAVEPQPAAADSVRIDKRLDVKEVLPGRYLTLDHPIERA